MGTTALSVFRPEIERELGVIEFATTTNLAANNVVISTELADDYDQPDYFIGWYIIILGSSNDRVVKRVTDYVGSSGTLTVAGAALQSESGAMNCELHRFHPEEVRRAANAMRRSLFPELCIVRDIRTLVTGQQQYRYTLPTTLRGRPLRVYVGNRDSADDIAMNLFTDGGFEIWTNSTTLTNFTLTGTNATVNQEKETTTPKNYAVLHDESSARVLSASSGLTTLLEAITPSVAAEGMEVNVSVWVHCNVTSRVAARLEGSGITNTSGSTHGGTGWELLTVGALMTATGTAFSAGIDVTSGAAITFYVDEGIVIVGQSEVLDLGWSPLLRWDWLPPIDGGSNGGVLDIPYRLPEKRRLRIIGRDLLSSVTADADTIEIDGEQLDLLYEKVRAALCWEASHGGEMVNRSYWASRAQGFERRVNELLPTASVKLPLPLVQIADWSW